ncbi:hypothetical protein H6F89_25100 [Cyanobacteria bacterium FACHB-63]|nr:hypothetical protein [Cyanobacteria bacterium FACHB-63]
MENNDPIAEPVRHLSDLEQGDIVVLTLDPVPGFATLNRSVVERTARITLKLSNSFTVENRRFSISSGKEMMNVGSGWRIDGSSEAFISVPTIEQLERLPDPDGNYTEAQIRKQREDSIESIITNVRGYLDPESPEFDQRKTALFSLLLVNENARKTWEWVLTEEVNRLKGENKDLKSRLKQLETILRKASILAEAHNLQVEYGVPNTFTTPDEDQ